MGLTCGVESVGASSGCVEVLESQLQTRMLTLIFVFGEALEGFGEGFRRILHGFLPLKYNFLRIFFENVDSVKIVLPSRPNS